VWCGGSICEHHSLKVFLHKSFGPYNGIMHLSYTGCFFVVQLEGSLKHIFGLKLKQKGMNRSGMAELGQTSRTLPRTSNLSSGSIRDILIRIRIIFKKTTIISVRSKLCEEREWSVSGAGSGPILVTNESEYGSGRPNNIRIIRNRNTASNVVV
jgi:hypothetical protein